MHIKYKFTQRLINEMNLYKCYTWKKWEILRVERYGIRCDETHQWCWLTNTFKSTPDCRAMVVYTNYIVYENMINFKIIVIDNKPFTHINETIL